METSVKKIKKLPLRKYLVFSVLITLAIIVLFWMYDFSKRFAARVEQCVFDSG